MMPDEFDEEIDWSGDWEDSDTYDCGCCRCCGCSCDWEDEDEED